MDNSPAQEPLFREILTARQRVYAVGRVTPMEVISLADGTTIYLKREDRSPIHAYKWRGAFNKMAALSPAERQRGVVAASAGNHAQGIALGAARLGIPARIFMPVVTPRMKQEAVARHGGSHVEIILQGDTFHEAFAAAGEFCQKSGHVMIHPFDDLAVMGGQGTIGDEIVMSGFGPFDCAFLQIGGGGMAAAVACWLRYYYPRLHIIGVEGTDQACMQMAVKAGKPVDLDYVDVFCDGTAVRRAGTLTYPLCARYIDEFRTVTNEEVCAAVQFLWDRLRLIPEPAGAMGLAAWMKAREEFRGRKILAILCGANMDFAQLAWIVRHAGIGSATRKFFRFQIAERNGTLHALLTKIKRVANIIEFQYGKTDTEVAYPVIGFDALGPALDLLKTRLDESGIPYEDVTGQQDVEFRVINYNPALFRLPYFIRVEFPERAGALSDFLGAVHAFAGICYFNYNFTGERVGRALLGFEFAHPEDRRRFIAYVHEANHGLRAVQDIPDAVLHRIL